MLRSNLYETYNIISINVLLLLQVAPFKLEHVYTTMCGSCANELAFKAVFRAYANKMNNNVPESKEKIKSSIVNKYPGCSKYSIMSFWNASHGRSYACQACTHTKFLYKIDCPSLRWPIAKFPIYKYPLHENTSHNFEQDENSLGMVEDLFIKYKKKGFPIAGGFSVYCTFLKAD